MSSRPARAALAIAFLVSLSALARSDSTVLKVIPLKHRPAAHLVPVLAPLAGPGGSVTSLDMRLIVNATPQALAGGVGGTVSTHRTVVRGALGAESASSTDDATQQIRTLEGYPALIRVGHSEPFNALGMVESGTGFHVLPRLSGDLVTLELWAENTRSEGPVVVGQDLRTTVTGRLGEWIEVGSALHQAETRAREILGASFRAVSEERSLRLRVDEVR
jgi:hypothetical protein